VHQKLGAHDSLGAKGAGGGGPGFTHGFIKLDSYPTILAVEHCDVVSSFTKSGGLFVSRRPCALCDCAMQQQNLAALGEDTKARLRQLREAAAAKAAGGSEPAELSASSQAAILRQQELKDTIEKRKRARELAVPTNDNAVKLKLREFGEPIIIFGEDAPERRERLRDIMAQHLDLEEPYEAARGAEVAKIPKRDAIVAPPPEDKRAELFFSEGSEELKAARRWIGRDSLERAERRLANERARIEQECSDVAAHEASQQRVAARLRTVQNQLSNFGDERPISFVSFAPGSSLVATGSWSNLVKLWSIPDCNCVATLKGHSERISGLSWHPQVSVDPSNSVFNPP
jgi:hypothetical protein